MDWIYVIVAWLIVLAVFLRMYGKTLFMALLVIALVPIATLLLGEYANE